MYDDASAEGLLEEKMADKLLLPQLHQGCDSSHEAS